MHNSKLVVDNLNNSVYEIRRIVHINLKIVNNFVNSVDNHVDLWKNSEECELLVNISKVKSFYLGKLVQKGGFYND